MKFLNQGHISDFGFLNYTSNEVHSLKDGHIIVRNDANYGLSIVKDSGIYHVAFLKFKDDGVRFDYIFGSKYNDFVRTKSFDFVEYLLEQLIIFEEKFSPFERFSMKEIRDIISFYENVSFI